MDNAGFLIAAYLLVWLMTGGYLLMLGKKQKEIDRRISQMQQELQSRKPTAA